MESVISGLTNPETDLIKFGKQTTHTSSYMKQMITSNYVSYESISGEVYIRDQKTDEMTKDTGNSNLSVDPDKKKLPELRERSESSFLRAQKKFHTPEEIEKIWNGTPQYYFGNIKFPVSISINHFESAVDLAKSRGETRLVFVSTYDSPVTLTAGHDTKTFERFNTTYISDWFSDSEYGKQLWSGIKNQIDDDANDGDSGFVYVWYVDIADNRDVEFAEDIPESKRYQILRAGEISEYFSRYYANMSLLDFEMELRKQVCETLKIDTDSHEDILEIMLDSNYGNTPEKMLVSETQ